MSRRRTREWCWRLMEIHGARDNIVGTDLRRSGCVLDVGQVVRIELEVEVAVGIAEQINPRVLGEFLSTSGVTGNGLKLVVEDDMILCRDFSSVKVQDKRYAAGMGLRHTHVHVSTRAFLPMADLLTIRQFLFQNIDGTSPNMKVMKIALRPASLGKDVVG